MKVGVFTCWLRERPLEVALDFIASLGITTVEIGTGGYPRDEHAKPADLLADARKLATFRHAFASRGMTISALSCQGNPLHPNRVMAEQHHRQFSDSVLLAEQLGVAQVVTFSGCPGTREESEYPNWVTSTFPSEFNELLKWQWDEKVIPYWREQADFCSVRGVKVAIELHPGFVVYNTASFLKLREAVGETLGATYDPSHLLWQQMDPLEVIRALGPAIYHVHAKDTTINIDNIRRNGVLDTSPPNQLAGRSWMFRTVGYGHDAQFWKALISQLRLVGYSGALSIEAEDSLMSKREGLERAIHLLNEAVISEAADAPWWV